MMGGNFDALFGELNDVTAQFQKKAKESIEFMKKNTETVGEFHHNAKKCTMIKLSDGNVLITFDNPTDNDIQTLLNRLK